MQIFGTVSDVHSSNFIHCNSEIRLYNAYDLLQIPVSLGVSGYEAVSLYKGLRRISSRGEERTNWKIHQLISYCLFGVLAGVVGGLLGLGGGFIMGPLFLELGVPPQVSLVDLLRYI